MNKRTTKKFGLLLSVVLMSSIAPMDLVQSVAYAISADTAAQTAYTTASASGTNISIGAGSTIFTPVDNQAPALASVTSASETGEEAAGFTVQANEVADSSGVKSVSFVVYRQADGFAKAITYIAGNSGDGVWSKDIDLSSLGNKPGNYIVKVWARDNLNNAGMIGSVNINYAAAAYSESDKIDSFIRTAEAQLGKKYVRGGKGPSVFDCSGLVYYALQSSGKGIPYMTSGSWAESAYPQVNSLDDLQRGDVVCFRGHVGIYLGGGAMVDASSSQGKVRKAYNIQNSSYWKRNFICGRRPLQ